MAQANFDNITSINDGPFEPATMLNQLRIAGSQRPADKVVAAAYAILQNAQRPSINPNADFDASALAFETASGCYASAKTDENLWTLAWALVAVITPIILGLNDASDQVDQALVYVKHAPAAAWTVIADGQDRSPEEMRSAVLDQLAGIRDRQRCQGNAGNGSYPAAV